MSFFTNIISSERVKSFFWGSINEVPSNPKTLGEVYKENLSTFSARSVSLDGCIKNCITSVENVLQPADCDLSEISQKVIEFHLNNFNKAVEETYLYVNEPDIVNTEFKKSLCEVIEGKWAVTVAKSFYSILSISDEKERVAAVQKWTHQYFVGVDYFNKWKGLFTFIQKRDFVINLEQKTILALHNYSNEVAQEKIKVMLARAEKHPLSFASIWETAMAKEKEDPNSLSILEKEYVEFRQILKQPIASHSMIMNRPDVDKKIELLKKCIWDGYIPNVIQKSN
ncbi:MAG TPA: hypothetical protein VLG49_00620 [Rhabdochlamydiaceae bacterium]|nr:hypothetical protein [Rhabdochlamydiaceae bacterium]